MSGYQITQLIEARKDPAKKVEQGVAHQRLAGAVLLQAIKDAEDGRDTDYLTIWKDTPQVEELCALSGTDINHYRRKLDELLSKRRSA
jgi:hypothetical protein